MFHDQYVSHKRHVFVIFLMSWPEPPMGISSAGSFPVQSQGSLFFPQFFKGRNLALTMDICTSFRGRHVGCQAYWYVCLIGGICLSPI